MQIWPAIDLRDGKCVRLRQGDYQQETVFGDDPVEVARQWQRQGAKQLHLVDLDAAKTGIPANHEIVARIASSISLPCQLGGGIRDESTIAGLLSRGISRLVVGTKAIKDPDWFSTMCNRFPKKLALGIDARDGLVASDGWLETSEISAVDLARRFADEPIGAIIYTDIAKDGMMSGPNLSAISRMSQSVDTPVIASGGVTTSRDVSDLAELGLAGCIVGRTLYEGKLRLSDAMEAAGAMNSSGGRLP